MGDRIAQGLLQELEDFEQELAVGQFYDFDRDLSSLVEAILTHAGRVLDVARLDAKAQASESLDVATLRSAIERLDTAALDDAQVVLPGGKAPLVGREALTRAREMLILVEDAAKNQHSFETGARLELGLSPSLFRVQMVLADKPEALSDLEHVVRQKIGLLPEQEVRRLWATLTSEFQPTDSGVGRPPMPMDTSVLGKGFFDPVTLDNMRDRIASYVVLLRPLLVRKMLETGDPGSPISLPQVAQFLALRVVESLTLLERRLLECLLKIYRVWGRDNEDEFLAALELSTPNWTERAAQLDETLLRHKETPSNADKHQLLLIALRRLLRFANSWVSFESPMERVLLQYKLGLEVMLPGIADNVISRGELGLQKELRRFLIERDIRAFGKLFGRSEIDLLAELSGERLLIETKVVKVTSARGIERNVTQLISYMDQEEPATRGVLVLFNVSDTVISADRRWYRERLWILPINLCPTSPSRTTKRLTIEDGGADTMLRFLSSGGGPSRITSNATSAPKTKASPNRITTVSRSRPTRPR